MRRGERAPVRVLVALASGAAVLLAGFGLARALGVLTPANAWGLSLPATAAQAEAEDGMTPVAHMRAPAFRLEDQRGATVSLARFRSDAVVLTFLDPVCWYQCPLQAQDMKLMLSYLPRALRSRVALVAVAANPVIHSLAAVRAFDREERLGSLARWYFLTAPSTATLRRVWKAYYVSVSVPRDGMVNHSQVFYLIGPGGHVRFLSSPADTPGGFVGTAELLAAYVAHILGGHARLSGQRARAAAAEGIPFVSSDSPTGQARTDMRTGRRGWRVTRQGGYEVLLATRDGGRSWKDVSPTGVTKRGGLMAAFGAEGRAWVVVLPWGYTRTPLSFYTRDWGANWRFTDILPQNSALGPEDLSLAGQGRVADLIARDGLWQATGGSTWRRLGPTPWGRTPRGTVELTLDRRGRPVVAAGRGRWTWTRGRWRPGEEPGPAGAK